MEGDGLSQNSPLDEDFNPELPAGGFRVLKRSDSDATVASVNVSPVEEASFAN